MYEAPPVAQRQPVMLDFIHPKVIVTWILLAINLLMYGYAMLQGFSFSGNGENDVIVLIELGAKYAPLMDIDGEWWRLLTPMVLHGGLIHLGFNSYALYILGPEVERLFGAMRFFVIYLIAGLVGTIASYMFGNPFAPAIGASGAIFGLMGAIAAFSYRARNTLGEMARRILQQVIALAAINLLIGFSLSGIDNYAHVGGLVSGGAVGLLLAPRLRFIQDPWQPRIVADRNHVLGWFGCIIIIAGSLAAMWYIHLQRLNDPALRNQLIEYSQFFN